jgi:WD40 repeat protein
MKPRIFFPLLLAGLLMACNLSDTSTAGQTPTADLQASAQATESVSGMAAKTVAVIQTGTASAGVDAATATPAAPTQAPGSAETGATPTLEPTLAVPDTVSQLITLENAPELKPLQFFAAPELRKVVFSADSSMVAASSGNESNFGVSVWRTGNGDLLHTFTQYSGIVWDAAFSPDGTLLATVQDDPVHSVPVIASIWKLADESLVASLNGLTSASTLAFSPDGTLLAIGGLVNWPNGTVWLYDTATWTVKRQLSASGENVTSLAFSPDGSVLVAGGTGGGIHVWKTGDGNLITTLNGGKQANDVAITVTALPGSVLVASITCDQGDSSGCTQGGVSVWNLNDKTKIQQFDDVAQSVAFSPDGNLLVTGSGTNDPAIRIRSTKNWAVLATFDKISNSVAFSPDGTFLASLNFDDLTLWGIPQK